MEENITERLESIGQLHNMLDTVTNNNKNQIVQGKKEIVDITKHSQLSFEIEENVELTKDVYEVITDKNGVMWHEFYDDHGVLLNEISDEEFQKGKMLTELGQGTFQEHSLIDSIYHREDDKSLTELENEQNDEIANTLGMNKDDIKELDILTFSDKSSTSSEKATDAKHQLDMLANIGFSIDTNELATSNETIKNFLNIDADRLLIVKVNGTWKTLAITESGKLEIEDNLQVVDTSKSFTTVNQNDVSESRYPTVEFRRKDNPDYSLAIDTNKENKTRAFLVVGESRTASEIEVDNTQSPYADVKNNELMQEAEQNPDQRDLDDDEIDPHEPDEPSLELGSNHY